MNEEILLDVYNILNYDDDGDFNLKDEWQVIFLVVVGIVFNFVIYVVLSDFWFGGFGGDINKDINFGMIMCLIWIGFFWSVMDLVCGLFVFEENYVFYGLELVMINGMNYLFLCLGG